MSNILTKLDGRLYTLVGMFYGTKWNNWRTPYYLPSRILMILTLFVTTTEIFAWRAQRQKVRAGIVIN